MATDANGLPVAEPGGRVTEPDGAPRIAILDILRGIAILGILFMNVNDMGQSFSGPDIRHLGWAPADQFAWWARSILADGTARALLEMLFGAGMLILTDRIARGALGKWRTMRRYYWRNIWLWLFGLAHIFVLLWPGDILHTYGIAALIAFWFRRLPPRWLFLFGLLGATLQLTIGSYMGVVQPSQRRAAVATIEARRDAGQPLSAGDRATLAAAAKRKAERAKEKAEHIAEVAAEDRSRSGTSWQWIKAQWAKGIERLGIGELFAIWEATGTMLIGAALYKLGILQGGRSRGTYLRLMLLCYAIGFPLRAWAAWEQTRFDDRIHFTFVWYEYARLAATLGHVALVNWLAKTGVGATLLKPFVAAGRTALSLYVLQTILFLGILFPPWGLAMYGKLTWMPMMLACAATDLVLLWIANLWVRYYAIAPVEWAWRSIVERRRLPMRVRRVEPAAI